MHGGIDVADAVRHSSSLMGRPHTAQEDHLVHVLRENWYSTAADLANMSMAEAEVLKVPYRLCMTLKKLLDEAEAAGGLTEASSSVTAAIDKHNADDRSAAEGSNLARQVSNLVETNLKHIEVVEASMIIVPPGSTSGRHNAMNPDCQNDMTDDPTTDSSSTSGFLPQGASADGGNVLNKYCGKGTKEHQKQSLKPQQEKGLRREKMSIGAEEPGEVFLALLPLKGNKTISHAAPGSDFALTSSSAIIDDNMLRMAEAAPLALISNIDSSSKTVPLAASTTSLLNHSTSLQPAGVAVRLPMNEVRTTKRKRQKPYAMKPEEMSPHLTNQLEAFRNFCVTRFFGQQQDPITHVTARTYEVHLRRMLGWLHYTKRVPLEEVCLERIFPTKERNGVALTFDYLQWLTVERSLGIRTQQLALHAILQGAKFLFHEHSKVRVFQGDMAYSDLDVVQELRAMLKNMKQAVKVAPPATDSALKWLDWPDFLKVVECLRLECANFRIGEVSPESNKRLAISLQKYLIFAILSCIPDRQRTIRELRLGTTLVKDEVGRWVIRHGPRDYKTGKAYGERPPLVISTSIYPELEAWISTYRAYLDPKHDYLFTTPKSGQPYSAVNLSNLFSETAYRISGKSTSPHMVRDMIVTYLRGGNASVRELEALAIYMGHSLEMQRDSYDRRTKAQKVEPAVELLYQANLRAGAASRRQTGAAGTSAFL
ncbi:hypothetical protein CEUSTIGMA_g12964.t1 [Chlamydomonas eustigma]|uniref:Tyr recombinase domain-containing protein n=1 Tax=Chlamydomonas eustigma TaxID=1157962 RepID=A0A250XRH9_9CHLO|nr:hypothetical protein CEUSTIGMA_g12964.t1 [Chlamydomonas eustigma]|eukprot:GAX85549.1 hypothetical protein CEUSTIGMA_g12964.t1 [Chlamydomonas eustigma]